MTNEAYPLSWPAHYPRNPRPKFARFHVTFAVARDHLLNELRLMGARNVVISSNVPLRRDGLPYANHGAVEDAGVAVYFERDGKPMCIPCDEWRGAVNNVRAIGKTVEAVRGIERWAAKAMVDAAFEGIAALPETATAGDAWWWTLGADPDADLAEVRRLYTRLAKEHHPDVGGDREEWERIQAAYEQAKQAVAV